MLHKLRQVIWMDQATPIADRDLRGLLGKAIDGGEPGRKPYTVRAKIFPCRVYVYYEASDQRGSSSKLELPVAVGEGLFHPSAFGDIDVDADHPLGVPLVVVRDETA